jgi:hypothetical protein
VQVLSRHEIDWIKALVDELEEQFHVNGWGIADRREVSRIKSVLWQYLDRREMPSLANDAMEPEKRGGERR